MTTGRDGRPPASPHLTDEEIDQYWAGRLADEDVRRVEEHYLGCASCHGRIELVEQVIGQLAAPPDAVRADGVSKAWRLVAAFLTIACVFLGWPWIRSVGPDREAIDARARPEDARLEAGVSTLRIAPPTRDATSRITLQATRRIVLLVLDVREAGPAASFDVSLRRADTPGPLLDARIPGSPDDHVDLPVSGSLLPPGDYLVEVKSDRGFDVTMPFSVTQ